MANIICTEHLSNDYRTVVHRDYEWQGPLDEAAVLNFPLLNDSGVNPVGVGVIGLNISLGNLHLKVVDIVPHELSLKVIPRNYRFWPLLYLRYRARHFILDFLDRSYRTLAIWGLARRLEGVYPAWEDVYAIGFLKRLFRR